MAGSEGSGFCIPMLLVLAACVFVALCDQDVPAEVPFRVTRVDKRVTGDSIRVRVMYEGSATPTILLGDEYYQPAEQGAPGMVEFDTPNRRNAHAKITFVLPDRRCAVSLDPTDPHDSMDIPAIRLNVLQGEDIQLQPGQQVNAVFTLAVEGGVGNGTVESTRAEVLIRSDTEGNVIDRYRSFYGSREADVQVDVEELGEPDGLRYERLVVKSSSRDITAGVVNIVTSVRFSCYDNCLVYHVLDTHTVRFYPQGAEGPFPRGFIGFIHDSPSSTHFSCPVNSSDCYITCEAMGDGLTGIDVTKMTSSPGEALADVSVVRGGWGESRLHVPDVSFQDAGDFLCTARSQARGIAEQLTLGVLQRALIDRESTTFNRFKNGTMLFICVANGIPAPNVTFTNYLVRPLHVFPQTHVTHPSQSQTRAVLLLRDPARSSGQIGVYCHAQNADDTGLSSIAFADIFYYY